MAKDEFWSWLVLFGAFTAMFLETGMIKSLGVLLPELREQFTTYTWVIGLSISLAPGFGAITCIGATALRKISSNRFILMCFGVISSLGLLISALASSVKLFSLGLVLTGFSFGAEATTFAVLPDFFDKYYDISNSIAHSGLSLGVMIMPILTQYLLDIYGWRGTALILCAMNTNIVVAGALIRPITNLSKTLKSKIVPDSTVSYQTNNTPSKLHQNLWHIFGLDMFKNFQLVGLLSVCFGIGVYYTGWLIYFVPHAQNLGYSSIAASTLATVGGVGNLIGSFAFPVMGKAFSSRTLIILCHIFAFLSLIIDPMFSIGPVYYGLMACSFTLNYVYALFGCAINKEALTIVTDEDYHGFVNWGFVVYGAGSILSGYFAGLLFDKFETYTPSFIFLSIAPLLSLLPMFFDGFFHSSKGQYTSISKQNIESTR